jgi:hypothetical protein
MRPKFRKPFQGGPSLQLIDRALLGKFHHRVKFFALRVAEFLLVFGQPQKAPVESRWKSILSHALERGNTVPQGTLHRNPIACRNSGGHAFISVAC